MMYLYFFAISLFLLSTFVLCFVILIQEGKGGGGLGASFGGDTGDSLFGTATSDVLKKFTAWMVFVFFAFCVILSLWTSALARSAHKRGASPQSIEMIGE